MAICSGCGRQVNNSTSYCTHCSSVAINGDGESTPSPKKGRFGQKLAFFGAAGALVLGCAVFGIKGYTRSKIDKTGAELEKNGFSFSVLSDSGIITSTREFELIVQDGSLVQKYFFDVMKKNSPEVKQALEKLESQGQHNLGQLCSLYEGAVYKGSVVTSNVMPTEVVVTIGVEALPPLLRDEFEKDESLRAFIPLFENSTLAMTVTAPTFGNSAELVVHDIQKTLSINDSNSIDIAFVGAKVAIDKNPVVSVDSQGYPKDVNAHYTLDQFAFKITKGEITADFDIRDIVYDAMQTSRWNSSVTGKIGSLNFKSSRPGIDGQTMKKSMLSWNKATISANSGATKHELSTNIKYKLNDVKAVFDGDGFELGKGTIELGLNKLDLDSIMKITQVQMAVGAENQSQQLMNVMTKLINHGLKLDLSADIQKFTMLKNSSPAIKLNDVSAVANTSLLTNTMSFMSLQREASQHCLAKLVVSMDNDDTKVIENLAGPQMMSQLLSNAKDIDGKRKEITVEFLKNQLIINSQKM